MGRKNCEEVTNAPARVDLAPWRGAPLRFVIAGDVVAGIDVTVSPSSGEPYTVTATEVDDGYEVILPAEVVETIAEGHRLARSCPWVAVANGVPLIAGQVRVVDRAECGAQPSGPIQVQRGDTVITVTALSGGSVGPVKIGDVVGLTDVLAVVADDIAANQHRIADLAAQRVDIAVHAGVGALVVDVDAVDGTASTLRLLGPDPTTNPVSWVALSADLPIGQLAAVIAGAMGPPVVPSSAGHVLVPGVGVFDLAGHDVSTPWPAVDVPVGAIVTADPWVVRHVEVGGASAWPILSPLPTPPDPPEPVDDARPWGDLWRTMSMQAAGASVMRVRQQDPRDDGVAWVSDAIGVDLPGGWDLRVTVAPHPPREIPLQRYMEVFARENLAMAGGNDQRAAVEVGSDGLPLFFAESAPIGGPGEESVVIDAGLQFGLFARLRVTVDCATQTLTLWRARLAPGPDTTTIDGDHWVPVASHTDPAYASVSTDPTHPFKVGLRADIDVTHLELRHFGGSRIIGLTQSAIAAAVGTSTVTCDEGTVWTSALSTVTTL